ncbi:MAG: phage tail tape measure protein [Flavobacterium sp.]|nr:phage tail tape measure protein [Flavobacterium sp.]
MADSDKIRHEDLVESGLMDPTIKNFEELIQVVTLADQQVVKFGIDLNKSLQSIQPSSVQNLQQIFTLSNQINEADKSKIATAQILSELRLKEIEQKNALKVKMMEEAAAEKEKIKRAKEQQSAYGQLSAKYREAAQKAKDLAAAYGTESKQAKEAIKSAKSLNDQLKKIDASMGNHQRNVGNYSKAWGGLNNVLGAFGITLGAGAVIGALKESIGAFFEAEKNANALKFAVMQVGKESEKSFQSLIDQSAELQKISVYSDDDIQRAQTQLVNYGLTAREVEKLIPQVLDLASATGQDLASATDTVIKGINGQTKGLKVLGIDYKDTGDKAKNLAILTEQLAKFQGKSNDALDTGEGKWLNFKNQIGDIAEGVGEFMVTLIELPGALFQNRDATDAWTGSMAELNAEIARVNKLTAGLATAMLKEDYERAKKSGADGIALARMKEQIILDEKKKFAEDAKALDDKKLEEDVKRIEDDLAAKRFAFTTELELTQQQQLELLKAERDARKRSAALDPDTKEGAAATGGKTKSQRASEEWKKEYKISQDKKKQKIQDHLDEKKRYHDEEEMRLADIEARRKENEEIKNAQEEIDYWRWQQAKETEKKIAEERRKANEKAIEDAERLAEAVSDGLDRRYELQQEALQRESNLISSEVGVQAELFARGLENNLATQERLLAENTLKQQQLAEQKAKKDEAMQLASMFLELVKADGDVPKALAQTLVAKGIANAIAGSFAEGVEDFNGKGTGTSDSNIIRFSNGESVVTANATANNPGLVTAMNDGMVDDYFREIYLPQFGASLKNNGESTQRGSNWETAAMINELRELKKIVANKKETTVELSKTGDVIMTTVEQGIRKVVNRKPRKF